MSSPLMSQLSAPAVPTVATPQSQLEAAVAAVQPSHVTGSSQAAPVSPYQVVDWTSLGYTLPAPMYATL